ncbi:hypothetical protein DPMN_006893 [Dreissena polymorpha]|uniref:Uncharacterized protein n=1 Tax=Dreissena polymorpha TaxID=45954 RepID=A0A9D4RVE8_DREPO|nr:hypothetical protein DPMN_006893 [Dreissena polymorpha]
MRVYNKLYKTRITLQRAWMRMTMSVIKEAKSVIAYSTFFTGKAFLFLTKELNLLGNTCKAVMRMR